MGGGFADIVARGPSPDASSMSHCRVLRVNHNFLLNCLKLPTKLVLKVVMFDTKVRSCGISHPCMLYNPVP